MTGAVMCFVVYVLVAPLVWMIGYHERLIRKYKITG